MADANELVYPAARREILPQVREVPVIAGVNGIDVLRDMRLFLEDCSRLGFSGVHNFPTVSWFDGDFRRTLEGTGLGYQREIDMLNLAHELDMLTIGYAFNRKDTEELMHPLGVAVEGELTSLPGVGGELSAAPEETDSDDPGLARDFVQRTGIDAFAVNIGQAHLHGRNQVRLNLCRLAELRKRISVPLVLHGATSISQSDLKEAIQLGVRKVNVGSILKRSYFEAVRRACSTIGPEYNPYEVVGSGLEKDVLTAGRVALQKVVKELMKLLGSAGRA